MSFDMNLVLLPMEAELKTKINTKPLSNEKVCDLGYWKRDGFRLKSLFMHRADEKDIL